MFNNKMIKSFEEFITSSMSIDESKTETPKQKDGCNLVFVTKNPSGEKSHGEYSRFKKSCDKYGVNIYPVDVDVIKYRLTDDNKLDIDGVGSFSKNDTLFMFRHAVKIKSTDEEKQITQTNVKNFKKLLKANGFMMSNDSKVAGICKSKIKTFEVLEQHNVSTIDTIEVDRRIHDSKNLDSVDNMSRFLIKNNLQLPVVVKVNDGTQGCGVFKCEDINILTSIVQYLVRTKNKCLIQPFCEIDYDVRVHVFCKTLKPETAEIDDFVIVGSMRRNKVNGDFRTNFSLGGKISNYDLSVDEKKLAKEAAKAIGAVWVGVDLCHDNLTGKYYVIECNGSPALKGISQVVDKQPTDLMVKHIKKTLSGIKNTEKDIDDRELVSYYETIQLDGISIKGCFDTGNSATSAIKSNVFKVKDEKVTFEISGQEITKKIVRKKSVLHSGVKSEPRPVVHFDITFNGKTLKDVEVCVRGLTDVEKEREKKTGKKVGGNRILLSADVIDRLNLVVHPDRGEKFIKTKKPKK